MKLKCAIIDDEPLAESLLKNYVEKTPFLELAGSYTSAIKAMEEMGTTPKQTWLFEDGAYSIETAKQLGIKTIGIYDPASEKDQEKIRNLTNIYIKNWTEHKTLLNQIQNNK